MWSLQFVVNRKPHTAIEVCNVVIPLLCAVRYVVIPLLCAVRCVVIPPCCAVCFYAGGGLAQE